MTDQTPHSRRRSRMVMIAIAITAMIIGGIFSITQQRPTSPYNVDVELQSGSWLIPPKAAYVPTLIGDDGQPVDINDFKGAWHFLFFGYTHCPDVCPATMYHFKTIAKGLKASEYADAPVRFVLVSVDPQRDKPDHLRQYVDYYNPEFVGITGEPDLLQTFARYHGVIFQAQQPADSSEPDSYLVDHSSVIILLNPEARMQAVFPAPHEPDYILKDLQLILKTTGTDS